MADFSMGVNRASAELSCLDAARAKWKRTYADVDLRAAAVEDAIGVGDENFSVGAELPGIGLVKRFINAWRFMG